MFGKFKSWDIHFLQINVYIIPIRLALKLIILSSQIELLITTFKKRRLRRVWKNEGRINEMVGNAEISNQDDNCPNTIEMIVY